MTCQLCTLTFPQEMKDIHPCSPMPHLNRFLTRLKENELYPSCEWPSNYAALQLRPRIFCRFIYQQPSLVILMGYEVELFLSQVNEEFLCSMCLSVFEYLVQVPCGHVFCRRCITKWQDVMNSVHTQVWLLMAMLVHSTNERCSWLTFVVSTDLMIVIEKTLNNPRPEWAKVSRSSSNDDEPRLRMRLHSKWLLSYISSQGEGKVNQDKLRTW